MSLSAAELLNALLQHVRQPLSMEGKEGGAPFAYVPSGYTTKDLEEFLGAPVRKRASVSLSDTASFIGYVDKHKVHDHTTLYANADFAKQSATIVALLDDHGPQTDQATWRDSHKATYAPVKTVEWTRWAEKNKRQMDQMEFAEFLEDNLKDIAPNIEGMPTGAQILELATKFEAASDKKLASKISLQNGGYNVSYIDESTQQTVDSMKLFKQFSLGIRVFEGGDPYRLDARLKWRQDGAVLRFFYELIRPDQVFKDSVKDEIKKIDAALNGGELMEGEARYIYPILFGNPYHTP